MEEGKMCALCKKWFMPNKYRPNQEICSNLECQYKRQLENMKRWRNKNPNYFKYREVKDTTWKETCRERARKWRHSHLEYLKLYRQEHRKAHRDYMKKYMREYRRRKKEKEKAQKEGAPPEPGPNAQNEGNAGQSESN